MKCASTILYKQKGTVEIISQQIKFNLVQRLKKCKILFVSESNSIYDKWNKSST